MFIYILVCVCVCVCVCLCVCTYVPVYGVCVCVCTYVPVHGAELSPAERKGLIRARLVLVHKNVERAVHRLDLILVALHIHLVNHAVV